jgi:DNA-binding transcriptional MerR regulator
MYTVTQLARACGISRTALLYYESIGLMAAPPRSSGNYRRYGQKDLERLKQVLSFRHAGLKLDDIRTLMDKPAGDAAAVLQRRLMEIDGEIAELRQHQQSILKLLKNKAMRRTKDMTKLKWVEIMQGSGFTDEQMNRWHMEFERAAPADHQEFLEYLQIGTEEIAQIREKSRIGF